ncbi:MAG TPA: sulfite exporter TauE/SafE family protein [Kineosporiaceae bacterium]|nr:sulfite exporter TauE/SafE family protein [Kineosporiaceae bacterium]
MSGDVTGWLLAAGGGLLAGAVNAIAGGGTLITFPALLAAGLAPVTANVTSSVGLVAGYAGGTVGYRRELRGQGPRVRQLLVVAVVGGVLGAVILLVTPAESFRALVPWLVILSCLLLAAQPRLARAVAARRIRSAPEPSPAAAPAPSRVGADGAAPVAEAVPDGGDLADAPPDVGWAARIGVLVAAVYGSYFGAGLGVLLLAVLGVFLVDDLQRLNALKGLLSLVVNVVGVLVFAFSGRVDWPVALVVAVAAWLGGLLGVRVARVLPAPWLRAAVVVLGLVVAVVLLVRG